MRFFQPSRAVKVVTSPGVAPLNEASWSSLEKLVCPAGGESQESLRDCLEAFQTLVDQLPDYSLDHASLVGSMCKMSKGKRGGANHLRSEHLQLTIRSQYNFYIYAQFTEDIYNNKVPEPIMDALSLAVGCTLHKMSAEERQDQNIGPADAPIRPLIAPDVMRKHGGATALLDGDNQKKAMGRLGPECFGIGSKRGTEAACKLFGAHAHRFRLTDGQMANFNKHPPLAPMGDWEEGPRS